MAADPSDRPVRPIAAPKQRTVSSESLRPVHSAEDVRQRIVHMVDDLLGDYGAKPFVMVVVEQGGRRLAERLASGLRERGGSPELLYLRAWRTEGGMLGEPKLSLVEPRAFAGRDVVVVDDIVDEGKTLKAVLRTVQGGSPSSVRTAILVNKIERRQVDVPIDYVGFEIDSGWIVGYGMDLDGEYRDLDHLAIVD